MSTKDYQGQMQSEFLSELAGATRGPAGRGARRRRQVQQAQQAVEFVPDEDEEQKRRQRRLHQQQYERSVYADANTGAGMSAQSDILPTDYDELTRMFILAEVLGKPPPGLDDEW